MTFKYYYKENIRDYLKMNLELMRLWRLNMTKMATLPHGSLIL